MGSLFTAARIPLLAKHTFIKRLVEANVTKTVSKCRQNISYAYLWFMVFALQLSYIWFMIIMWGNKFYVLFAMSVVLGILIYVSLIVVLLELFHIDLTFFFVPRYRCMQSVCFPLKTLFDIFVKWLLGGNHTVRDNAMIEFEEDPAFERMIDYIIKRTNESLEDCEHRLQTDLRDIQKRMDAR